MMEQFAQQVDDARAPLVQSDADQAFAHLYNPAVDAGAVASAEAGIEDMERERANQAAQEEHARKQNSMDPSRARMMPNPDGHGYIFMDGNGERIDINKFSLITGQRPQEILADSEDPRDQQFIRDYQMLRTMTDAFANNDTETLAQLRQSDPDNFNKIVTQYGSPAAMLDAFKEHYKEYYSTGDMPAVPREAFGPRDLPVLDPEDPNMEAQRSLLHGASAPRPQEANQAPQLAGLSDSMAHQFLMDRTPGLRRLSPRYQAKRQHDDLMQSNPWFQYQNPYLGD